MRRSGDARCASRVRRLAARPRRRRSQRRRHADARSPDPRSDGVVRCALGDAPVDELPVARARRAADRRAAARSGDRDRRALFRRRRPAGGRRRPRLQVLDSAAAGSRRPRGVRRPRRLGRGRDPRGEPARGAGRPTGPAIRPCSSSRSRRSAPCSARCRCSAICLGHQLLGLALGHETFKLPFGHRGANHPVRDTVTGRVLVTVQNHGYRGRTPNDDVSHSCR